MHNAVPSRKKARRGNAGTAAAATAAAETSKPPKASKQAFRAMNAAVRDFCKTLAPGEYEVEVNMDVKVVTLEDHNSLQTSSDSRGVSAQISESLGFRFPTGYSFRSETETWKSNQAPKSSNKAFREMKANLSRQRQEAVRDFCKTYTALGDGKRNESSSEPSSFSSSEPPRSGKLATVLLEHRTQSGVRQSLQSSPRHTSHPDTLFTLLHPAHRFAFAGRVLVRHHSARSFLGSSYRLRGSSACRTARRNRGSSALTPSPPRAMHCA
jgi:hypothetical protein